MSFKIYVTDSLRGIYKSFGGEVRARYYDLVIGKQVESENRTAEEIIDGIRDKLNTLSEV